MGDEIKVDCRSSNAEKIRLFKSLFFGRQDVFARRFENAKKGTSGYSPCCQNQWGPACALKQHRKCSDCAARKFLPVSDEVVRWHLRGRDAQMKPFVMGAYPMESDETVRFAVIDFDKSDWRRDALFVVREARVQGLSPVLEKSRSGRGAHVWFFFASPVSARNVREVLMGILTRVLERHPEVGLDSYDRIIPCQDTLPKGGFGNLIALPLQAEPRKIDNSVFINDDWMPHPDQWAFLSSVKRMTPLDLEAVRRKLGCNGRLLRANLSATPTDGARPWAFFLPLWTAGAVMPLLPDAPSEADVNVVVANRVYIEQANLMQILRSDLIALASFVNPEFDARQRMKYSVYGQPRVISRALNGEKYLQIPRGCLESALRALKSARRNPVVEDKRYGGVPLSVEFHGVLRLEQELAVNDLKKSDIGILSAGTAFGKTVVAAYMIAARKVNTLVLVNRRQLQEQWIARLSQFLEISPREIGRIGGGGNRWTGKIDVAVLQSLSRQGKVDPRIREYGQIIVDECHAVAAESFEAAVDAAPSKYVLGLSATVDRKDGRHPLIMMQCGPIRHRVDPKTQAQREPFDHVILVRPTSFQMPVASVGEDGSVGYVELCAALAADAARNRQIVSDILSAVAERRSPVVLSDRREHVEALAQALEGRVRHVVLLMGGMGRRQLREARERLAAIPEDESRVILATGSFLGEGFDDARLDTLFLALPVSWRGRLTQFAGRLHRLHDGKREVRIYDYVDLNVAVCVKMSERRARAYSAIGYRMEMPLGADAGWPASVTLPVVPRWKETFAESVRRLCRDGVNEALANLFIAATLQFDLGEGRLVGRASAPGAVVKFLAARLESCDETRGRIQPDVRLPIPCGANPYLEVAFAAVREKLVILLDSSHDLADEEAYRRARREDFLLQKAGYRVLRFLVEDLCPRLGETMDVIRASLS